MPNTRVLAPKTNGRNEVYTYSLYHLILSNLKEAPDTRNVISRKIAFGFKLLSELLKKSFSFLQQK